MRRIQILRQLKVIGLRLVLPLRLGRYINHFAFLHAIEYVFDVLLIGEFAGGWLKVVGVEHLYPGFPIPSTFAARGQLCGTILVSLLAVDLT